MADLIDGDLPWHHGRGEGAQWEGGHCFANIFDEGHVRTGFGVVWLSLSSRFSGRRVSMEMQPGEALAMAQLLSDAARLAICAEALSPGDA